MENERAREIVAECLGKLVAVGPTYAAIRVIDALAVAGLEVRPTRCDAATARREEPEGDTETANMLAELRARRMDTRVVDLIERQAARVAELTHERDGAIFVRNMNYEDAITRAEAAEARVGKARTALRNACETWAVHGDQPPQLWLDALAALEE